MSKLEKKDQVVLSKRQAALMVDALMVAYGQIIDQIPLDDLVVTLAEMRKEIKDSLKKDSNE